MIKAEITSKIRVDKNFLKFALIIELAASSISLFFSYVISSPRLTIILPDFKEITLGEKLFKASFLFSSVLGWSKKSDSTKLSKINFSISTKSVFS